MAPIPAITIMIAIIFLFFVLLPFITLTTKKKKENLLKNLSRAVADNNLILCSQEILQNIVMGFDGIHRKIIILEKKKDAYCSSIISLDEVNDCQLVTNSILVNNSNFKKPGSENHAATLELQFDFINHTQPASIIFSNGIINSKKELDLLKAKAEYWCIMFSKMLNRQMDVRA